MSDTFVADLPELKQAEPTVSLPPLPEPAGHTNGDVFGHSNEPLYTSDQMRAYVLADRAARAPQQAEPQQAEPEPKGELEHVNP